MSNMHFNNFMFTNKTKSRNDITHTRIGLAPYKETDIWPGKFNIETNEHFWNLYHHHVFVNGQKEYLTEKQIPNGQILVDLDFRYSTDVKERQHSSDDVERIVDLYVSKLQEMYDIPDGAQFPIWALEKPNANCLEDKTKDGIHIVIGVQATKQEQLFLREQVMACAASVFGDLPLQNSYEDVFDKGISTGKTNWQVFGSQKPNNERYAITSHQNCVFDCGQPEWEEFDLKEVDIASTLPTISARYANAVRFTLKAPVMSAMSAAPPPLTISPPSPTAVCDVSAVREKSKTPFKQLEKVVKLLKPSRFDKNDDWTRAGFAIHFESNGSTEGLSLFKEMSRKVDAYKNEPDSTYDNFWRNANVNGAKVTMGTLKMWAKEDSPEAFENTFELQRLRRLANASGFITTEAEADLANFFNMLYGDEWFYKDGQLYHWNGCYWKTGEDNKDNREFTKQCQRGFPKDILKVASFYLKEAVEIIDERKREMVVQIASKVSDCAIKTKKTAVKNGILDSFKSIVQVAEDTDVDPYLFVFNNCVFDLKTGEQVDAGTTKDKFMTMSAGYDYRPSTAEEREEMMGILESIFPDEQERECHLTILATALLGITLEKFTIANGGGRNGKGLLHDLFKVAIGNYGYTMRNTVIVKERKDGADPNIANAHLMRFIIVREPAEDKRIEFSVVKELTGGDEINARANYSNRTKTKLHCTLLVEANAVPLLNCDGTKASDKERIIDIPFRSTFLAPDDEDIDNVTCFARNVTYKEPQWRSRIKFALFDIVKARCVEYVKRKMDIDSFIPQTIKDRTAAYLGKCNVVKTWFEETFERVTVENEVAWVLLKDVHDEFKDSDVYSNMNKAERRQYGKTKFCDQMAKWFKKDFADRATLPTKKRARKVLWSWKKVGDDDGDDDGDYDDSGLCC